MFSLVFIALTELRNINHSFSELVEVTNVKTQSANTMRDAIRLRSINLKEIQLTDDDFERDTLYMQFVEYAGIYRIARDNLIKHQMSDDEMFLLDQINAQARIAQPYNDRVAELLLDQTQDDELQAIQSKAEENQEEILGLLDRLVDIENEHAIQALASANKHHSQTRYVMFFLTTVAFLLCVFVAWQVIRNVGDKNRKITHQATHDNLTNLVNRHEFELQIENALLQCTKNTNEHSLLFMDLDQFKIVNDTCGHIAGDQLLQQATARIKDVIRDGDILARIGGDEFGLLLLNKSTAQASLVAEKIRKCIDDFRFSCGDKNFQIGISIGISSINKDSLNMSDVLVAADTACFMAKEKGRNLVHVYDPGDDKIRERQGEIQWITRITEALENNNFILHFQPIVPLSDTTSIKQCFEVLIRYQEPDGDIYPPGSFLPAAERYGKIEEIDYWVIKNALNWLGNNTRIHSDISISINLSGASLSNDSLATFIESHIKKNGISPQQIIFEITETSVIASLTSAVNLMTRLKKIGCRFALDDFGSGLSSFNYLKNLPVNILKIDGSFVRSASSNPIDLAMIKSINEIGHVMGMETIAEFVEDVQTLDLMKEIGVDYAQGFAIARPEEEPLIKQPQQGFG